jgi:hypothetical protein
MVAAVALLMTPLDGCFNAVCDCANDPGLLVVTGVPISEVALSGAACVRASFRCVPAGFDNAVHPDCTQLQILPHAEGECVVDLMTAGGPRFTVRRQFVAASSGDCCGGGFTEAHHDSYIDLRNFADAGSD